MDGKSINRKAIILHYVDDDPFSLKRNLVIYAINSESVDYREFFIAEEIGIGMVGMQMVESTPLKKMSTDGKRHRAKDIEYALKKGVRKKGEEHKNRGYERKRGI